MDPTHLTNGLRIVIDIPPLPLLANDFVGSRGNHQESNASESNGKDSNKGDSDSSNILSSPQYSSGENFDPSEEFGPVNNNITPTSESSSRPPPDQALHVALVCGDGVPQTVPVGVGCCRFRLWHRVPSGISLEAYLVPLAVTLWVVLGVYDVKPAWLGCRWSKYGEFNSFAVLPSYDSVEYNGSSWFGEPRGPS